MSKKERKDICTMEYMSYAKTETKWGFLKGGYKNFAIASAYLAR